MQFIEHLMSCLNMSCCTNMQIFEKIEIKATGKGPLAMNKSYCILNQSHLSNSIRWPDDDDIAPYMERWAFEEPQHKTIIASVWVDVSSFIIFVAKLHHRIELSITPSWQLYSTLIVRRKARKAFQRTKRSPKVRTSKYTAKGLKFCVPERVVSYAITSPLSCNVIHLTWQKRNTRKALYGRVLLIWSPPFLFIRSTKKSLLEGKLRSFKWTLRRLVTIPISAMHPKQILNLRHYQTWL